MDKQKNKLHFRRFEFKYLLTQEEAEKIREDIKYFLIPDPNVQEKEGYWVNSIYLDSRRLSCFWDKTDGLFFRKKIRFRVYGKKKDSQIFLELKRKKGDIILKDRLVVKRNELANVLEGSLDHLLRLVKKESELELIKEYFALRWQKALEPIILISYFRQPFISAYQDLRLTFDSDIKTTGLKDFSFDQDEDLEKDVLDKERVLELKFTGSLPYWLYHLIKKYNLKRQSFSKYCHGIEAVFKTAF